MKIPLRHIVVVHPDHPLEMASEENALALAARLWLDNECLCLFAIKLKLKVLRILRQDPCHWEEVVLVRYQALHSLEVSSQ